MTTSERGALRPTPSQTVGPFLSIGLTWEGGELVVPEGTPEAFWVRGRVLDGTGDVVPDALVETWQAGPDGGFDHPDAPDARPAQVPGFLGFGRSATDAEGHWGVLTVRPGAVPGADGALQAPHIDVSVFARGLLDRVVTRIYLPDEAEANAADPVLQQTAPERRHTLVATPVPDGLTFDIHLRGERETVFFDV